MLSERDASLIALPHGHQSDTNESDQPLNIDFSKHFLHNFGGWLSDLLNPANRAPELIGLLFGARGLTDSVIQDFQVLTDSRTPDSTSLQPTWNKAFESWQSRSVFDSELTWLDLLGWFCLRPSSTGELRNSDIEFHNTYFPNPGTLAAVFHSFRQA